MKKLILITAVLILSYTLQAQVGIGNLDPKAQLDITAGTSASEKDGLLIPRLAEFPTGVTADQDGMLVFITGTGVPARGFWYYTDGSGWTFIGSSAGNSLDEAYDEGGAGAGKTIIATDGAVTITGQDGILVTGVGYNSTGTALPVLGEGSRMFFDPSTAAFRAGEVRGDFGSFDDNVWDQVNLGEYSVGMGLNAEASGDSSIALGRLSEATGNDAVAIGNGTEASSTGSLALGAQTTATGQYATAAGFASQALGDFSFSIGRQADAKSYGEIVLGMFPTNYAASSTTAFVDTDRMFTVANGKLVGASLTRSNALTIFKSGLMNINDEYNMPLTDGNNGQVMTTDGSGNVTFQDPVIGGTGAEKIDDLTDGKSDNDGTNNGSSIFLGVNTGSADDSNNNANVGIGYAALQDNITGKLNVAVGWGSLQENLGGSNTALGYLSAGGNTSGTGNTAVGRNTLLSNSGGDYNTAIGHYAGWLNTGSGNLFLGANAGFNHGSVSNKLYIENSDADENSALIYGEFGIDNSTSGNILRTNGELQIGNPTGTGYALPTDQGTATQVLTSNGDGTTQWSVQAAALIDPKYPDGHTGLIPVTRKNFTNVQYTVPAGKNFYITNVYSTNNSYSLFIDTKRVMYGVNNSLASLPAISNPIIAGATSVISASNNAIAVNGFLVDATVTPITETIANGTPYTVPTGKTLVILSSRHVLQGIFYDTIIIDGISIYIGYGNTGDSTNNYMSFHNPIYVATGSIVSSSGGSGYNINGYLIDN